MQRKTDLYQFGAEHLLSFIKDDKQTVLSIIIHAVTAVLTWLKYSDIESQLDLTDAPNS